MVLDKLEQFTMGSILTTLHISINIPFMSEWKQSWNLLYAASGTSTEQRWIRTDSNLLCDFREVTTSVDFRDLSALTRDFSFQTIS